MAKYFTISEFIRSDTAIKKKIWNGAPKEAEDNINALTAAVLDPLREKYGKPIKVTSGYRSKEVNKSVGGVTGSQHLLGEAADIVASGFSGHQLLVENQKLGKLIVQAGVYDQVIFENVGRSDLLPEWIHVSHKRTGCNRYNILKKVKGTIGYMPVSTKELGL